MTDDILDECMQQICILICCPWLFGTERIAEAGQIRNVYMVILRQGINHRIPFSAGCTKHHAVYQNQRLAVPYGAICNFAFLCMVCFHNMGFILLFACHPQADLLIAGKTCKQSADCAEKAEKIFCKCIFHIKNLLIGRNYPTLYYAPKFCI